MKLLREQCIDRGYYYEFVGDIATDEDFECDFLLEVDGSLKVGKSLKVGGWLKVGKSLEVGEWLKVGWWLEVGGSLKVGGWLEVGEWLKVGEWLNGMIKISTHCKWAVYVAKSEIKIGCETATVEVWDKRFSENWYKQTDPSTEEYAMIKAAYQVARSYFLNVMPLIGTN